jgi:hypothetical protein
MRTMKIAALFCYFIGAVLTFDFAVPLDCGRSQAFWGCVSHNLLESAIDGAFWPIFWSARIALDDR